MVREHFKLNGFISYEKQRLYFYVENTLLQARVKSLQDQSCKLVNSDSMFFRKVQLHKRKLKHINKPWNLARISKI